MKNIIPLVVSVILGLAAVYIVSKLLFEQEKTDTEKKISVVVAARDLAARDELSEGTLTYKDIPESAVPRNALRWENVSLAYGQQLPHAVSRDDYILMTDIRIQTTLSDCTRQGEWTVPVTFSDPALVKMLMPDDEIAIISTYVSSRVTVDKEMTQSDGSGVKMTESRETSVLLPCVRVIGIANENGSFREGGQFQRYGFRFAAAAAGDDSDCGAAGVRTVSGAAQTQRFGCAQPQGRRRRQRRNVCRNPQGARPCGIARSSQQRPSVRS